ncbi:MAG: SGNH/GDSL hydrolase family protein [Clostridia bacterium]|nr:SGNH/GDSL hydrolase family protein [Clostridia bacterium]
MELKNKKMVFLGDSMTEGVGVVDKENNIYWQRFRQDGCEVYGYGIGGTRIAKQQTHLFADFDHPFFRTRVPQMEEDADIIIVFGGSNDYGHGDAALGTMDDRTDDTFYGALHLLYQDLINKYPKGTIVVLTPMHRPDEERVYNQIFIRSLTNLEGYVKIIEEVAAYYSLPVYDVYRKSGVNPSIPAIKELYFADDVHLNDKGHELLYEKLKAFLLGL